MMRKNSKTHGIDRYHDLEPASESQLKTIYADWAETYDKDNDHKLGTISQPSTVALLTRHCDRRDIDILDIGCGTGLVGHHLAKAGFSTFDGTDISSDMMEFARPRGYRRLFELAANAPLPVEDNSYDASLCVGVFTHGHLGPEGFDELRRVTKPGGLICFTVNEGVWDSEGFEQAISDRVAAGEWTILEIEKQDYMVAEGVQAWYIAARRI